MDSKKQKHDGAEQSKRFIVAVRKTEAGETEEGAQCAFTKVVSVYETDLTVSQRKFAGVR